MALERKTVLDRITVDRDGLVTVSLSFEITDDTIVDAVGGHRVALEPGTDLATAFQGVNEQITKRRWPSISMAQGLRVKAVTDIFWTQAVVDAWRTRPKPALPTSR